MVYQVGNMMLRVTQELFRGKVNDVYICEDITAVSKTYYTVWVIFHHDTVRRMLEIYEMGGERARETYIHGYSWHDQYLMIFDYKEERPLDRFLSLTVHSISEYEELCKNIITECIGSGIPYPILYLQLLQGKVNLRKEGTIFFGYSLDLAGASAAKEEKDCANLCNKLLLRLLSNVSNARTTSYRLLELKSEKNSYTGFVDLYKDINASAITLDKKGLIGRLSTILRHNSERIFRLLLFVCIILVLAALLMLISQIIFSDIPFLRMFVNSFKEIGTESMRQ